MQSVHFQVSVSTNKLSPVSLTPASTQTALMGNISLFLPFCLFIFYVFSSSATDVRGRETSGGQMMSFIDKLTAYPTTEGPCHRFCLDLTTHLPSLLTALSNKWRRKKCTNRAQIWFSSIGNRAFSVQWVIARGPLPFDVRHRNDTNCILPLWNTISSWRDGEHIHLLAWSFKWRAPILIWRDSSTSFMIKSKKGAKHRQQRRSLSDSEWSDLWIYWFHQDVD